MKMFGKNCRATLTYYLISIVTIHSTLADLPIYNIGGVLSTRDNEIILKETVENINHQLGVHGFQFNATSIIMASNPIRAALSVCDDLIPQKIYSVIVSHPPDNDLSPVSVSYTCGFYTIPVIGISARESAFSDKNVHKTFVRTVPPYSHQVDVWVELLKNFSWKQVVFIHSADEEGWAMLNRFQLLADDTKIGEDTLTIEKIIKFPSGADNYTSYLSVIPSLQSRVILLYASSEDSETMFRDAERLNLTEESYAWIVTEQALKARNIPIGVLGASLVNGSNELAHIKDAVALLAQAFKSLLAGNNLTEQPYSLCRESSIAWSSGNLIYKYLQQAELKHGATGQVSFDTHGDRLNPVYEIINIHPAGKTVVGLYGSTQPWAIDKPLILRDSVPIVFPGGVSERPKGVVISTHLKVLTLREKPFVEAEPKTKPECDYYEDPETKFKYRQVYCPTRNSSTGEVEEFCCWGYCVDMLLTLAKNVNFTFDLELDETGYYGSFERCNDTNEKAWNGMIGQLVQGNTDMIVAPLTVNPERAQYIDFSKPFKYQGLTILVKKRQKESSLASFLQPFENTLWILVGLSVHVVALVLYLLDRFSPFGRFKLAKTDDTEEDALNLSSAMWFAWGVLLNSGIGEGTPRSFSARVLGMVWAGFAMIIVASYTANLAAFLVLDRPEASISGIDDARLRNPKDKYQYATVRNSAVDMYFKRQVELSTMRRTMEPFNKDNAEEAIQAVKSGDLQAFIWDSSRLQYEAAKDCDLVTAGELFGRSAYAIGLQKNSPWKEPVSLAILNLHESGYMETLDSKFIVVRHVNCPERDSAPATLGLTNMAGVFMMVAGGIVAGVLLIFVEIAYKRHRGLKDKELELARNAADRWRGNIEKRRTLRQTLQKQREEQAKRNCVGGEGAQEVGTPPLNPPSFEEAMTYPIHPQTDNAATGEGRRQGDNHVEDHIV